MEVVVPHIIDIVVITAEGSIVSTQPIIGDESGDSARLLVVTELSQELGLVPSGDLGRDIVALRHVISCQRQWDFKIDRHILPDSLSAPLPFGGAIRRFELHKPTDSHPRPDYVIAVGTVFPNSSVTVTWRMPSGDGWTCPHVYGSMDEVEQLARSNRGQTTHWID